MAKAQDAQASSGEGMRGKEKLPKTGDDKRLGDVLAATVIFEYHARTSPEPKRPRAKTQIAP